MSAAATPPSRRPARSRARRARGLAPRRATPARSFLFTFIVVAVVAAFLAPILQSASLSLKTREQIDAAGAPL